MAKSKYEYVKQFEQDDSMLPNCWLVVRVDGKNFHHFTKVHEFTKPNDIRAIHLMNACAMACIKEFPDIVLAYGESDEYSFILHKKTKWYKRKAFKIQTSLVSYFASSFVFLWPKFFGKETYDPETDNPDWESYLLGETYLNKDQEIDGKKEEEEQDDEDGKQVENEEIKETGNSEDQQESLSSSSSSSSSSSLIETQPFSITELQYPPTFDARVVAYPTLDNLKDYLAWRQVDTHINNLYNTTFWMLILKGGMTNEESEKHLMGSLSKDKNEILFSQFGINYSQIPAIHRRGSIILKHKVEVTVIDSRNGKQVTKKKNKLIVIHEDMIKDEFWQLHGHLFE